MPDPKPKRTAIVSTGKTALATVAPEISVPLAAAEKTKEVLTGDIVVVRTMRNIGTKKNPVWQEKEVHYNLAAAGLGGLAIAGAALVGVVAWNGFGTLGGGFRGIKDSRKPSSSGNPVVDFFAAVGDAVVAPFKKLTGQP